MTALSTPIQHEELESPMVHLLPPVWSERTLFHVRTDTLLHSQAQVLPSDRGQQVLCALQNQVSENSDASHLIPLKNGVFHFSFVQVHAGSYNCKYVVMPTIQTGPFGFLLFLQSLL